MKFHKTACCRILVVDDDAQLVQSLKRFLEQEEYVVEVAFSGLEALDVFRQTPSIHLALVDLAMPMMDGITLMEKLREQDPELAVIIMTGFGSIENAVEAMKRGAEDYLTKPFDPDAVRKKVGRLDELFRLRHRVAVLEKTLDQVSTPFESLRYVSPAMKKVVQRARQAASSDASVLLIGETGTGKELLARAIHNVSNRRGAPFIAVNCGALPHELVETELFGSRRGAFTGAYLDTAGIFAAANRGTVFLDEIGEMPKNAQVKLLRVLQEKEFRPVGSTKSMPVDIRVIAATNRPIPQLRSEYMREDLFYRLATVVLEVPPLRSRPEDIFVIAQDFLKRLSQRYEREIRLNRSAWDLLLHYSFPGNVRELQNILEGIFACSHGGPHDISDKDLKPILLGMPVAETERSETPQPVAIESLERIGIQRALRMAHGNRTKAAAMLGISRDTLYRKLRAYRDSLPSIDKSRST
jgi:two-component system response regulator AtoC